MAYSGHMANITIASVDDGFGPFFVLPGRQTFDLTLFFEDTILSILPSSLLLLAVPIRIAQLWQASRKVTASYLRTIKIAMLAVYSILQIANLVVWSLDSTVQTRASLAAASLSLAAALALCALSYIEHTRCIHPSYTINAYLLVTVPMDAAKVRTLWLRRESPVVASITSGVLAVKLLVLVVEAIEKRKILLSPYSDYSPEATSGLYSRGFFWWLNPIFILGNRNILRDVDLFPTDESLMSESLRKRFQNRWLRRDQPSKRYQLVRIMTRSMLGPLAAGVVPRLCQTFFQYMQPFLIRRVTEFVHQPDSQSATNQGWGLTSAYGLVYIGIALSAATYHHRAFRFATMVRGALVTSIYTKTLELSITALDGSAAVTLMSTDVQRICDALPLVHELWGCPIDIGLAIYLLQAEIGLAMLGPLLATIFAVSVTLAISSHMATTQKDWLATIQARVDVTAKALQTMKGVKMLGFTSTLINIIQRLRETEIASSIKARRLFAYSLITGNTTDIFAPGVAFTIFVIVANYNGQTLDVSSAYTSLSLIALLASPIGVLSFTVPPLVAAIGCFDRIQDYLLSTSRNDHRLLMPISPGQHYKKLHEIGVDAPNREIDGIKLDKLISKSKTSSAVAGGISPPIIQVVNCTLSWNDIDRPVINDVSFEVSQGLTMLVGPVGSGKSSMIKGLLGEIPSSKGYIYADSLHAAFVDQTPWIQHGTLRENIVGISIFEHKFYSTVIHACALDQDFDSLPLGDQTPVGSAGVGLSGGQKLRVALARAVYSRRHIIVLDDVFSGLDATSEDRIFSRLLGRKGLLRDVDTTVLLATHAVHRLSYADKIIALGTNGSVCEQGSFAELMKAGGYISGLAARHIAEAEDKAKEVAELTRNAAPTDSAHENAADDLKRSVGDVTIYKYYFASTGYRNTVLFLFLMASFAFFLQFPALWVNFWTSAVTVKGNAVNGEYLGVLLSLEVVAYVSLIWVTFHAYTLMVPRSALELHGRLLSSVRNAPLSFFTSTDIGQVVNRFSQDMNVADFELPSALFEFTASSCIGIMQAILICLSAAYFAAIMPAVLALMYLLQKFYLRTSRQIRLMDLEAKSPLYSNFIESLNGLITIRAFGWSNDFEERNIALLDKSQRPFYMLFCVQRWLNLVLDLTVAGLAVLLMILVVLLRSRLDAGLVGLGLLNVMGFNLSLTMIIKHWTSLETSLGAISRVKTFVQDITSEHLPQETQSIPDTWPSLGTISLSHVSASYTASGPSVLKDISLTIPAGQRVGLVGRSGSGKSSFVTTLFHMLELTHGTIKIDSLDLATLPREAVRQRLNVIPQDPLFLAGSIRLNLDPFSLATSDQRLTSTLRAVGLWTPIRLAGGLDVPMDAENLLSHGQRQLFCLARAMLNQSQSKILILDEATASVDLRTDETMQRIIREEFKGCTVIAVAHRLGTIRDFDRVVVLDGGRVVEDGAPEELLREEGSWFRRLWDS